jgi:hypothetical protein
MPSWWPTSKSVLICGRLSCKMGRASRSNRARTSGVAARCEGNTLTATSRPRRMSWRGRPRPCRPRPARRGACTVRASCPLPALALSQLRGPLRNEAKVDRLTLHEPTHPSIALESSAEESLHRRTIRGPGDPLGCHQLSTKPWELQTGRRGPRPVRRGLPVALRHPLPFCGRCGGQRPRSSCRVILCLSGCRHGRISTRGSSAWPGRTHVPLLESPATA